MGEDAVGRGSEAGAGTAASSAARSGAAPATSSATRPAEDGERVTERAVKRLLIVANVPSANTRALARAALEGARDEDIDDVEALHLAPLEAGPEDVLGCDAIVLGTTENFGYMSGALKDFLERVYHPCLERSQGLPWALYVRAGNDGRGTVDSVTRIVTGLRWRAVREPLVLRGTWRESFLDETRELGTLMGASLDAGVI